MNGMQDFNNKIIDEFRANEGVVGGMFEGAPILLLHSLGAKSGQERINPMMYQKVGDDYAVFASMAGAPTNPAWYHNLKANPSVRIEVGTDDLSVVARQTEGDERETIWETQKARFPTFADYEAKTSRVIPVMVLSGSS
jgi:deazaflavin-dependent oxidoreductase (nitroreductase family)